jgi:HEAT repeat protein
MEANAGLPIALCLIFAAGCAKNAAEWRAEFDDADPYVRGMAAIGFCVEAPDRADEAFPFLFDDLTSQDAGLANAARRVLELSAARDPSVALGVLTRWPALEPDPQLILLDGLALAGERAIPAITAAIHSPGNSNPRMLAGILARTGEPGIDALLDLLARDPDPIVRASAAWSLGGFHPRAQRAIPALARAARSDEPVVARAALQSLARIEPSDAIESLALPVLRESLARGDPKLRDAAVDALATIHLSRAALSTPGEREEAALEILRCGEDAYPALLRALDESDPDAARFAEGCLVHVIARCELLHALCADRGPRSRPDTTALEEQLSVQVVTSRALPGSEISRALEALDLARRGRRSEAELPLLASALSDPSRSVRWCAEMAIFAIVIDRSGALAAFFTRPCLR